MMDTTKPETLPLFTSLAEAGWKVETGEFGFNGNPKKYSGEYRVGLGGAVCREVRVTHPTVRKFYCILKQVGDDNDFSVEIIAPKAKPHGLGRKYFYPGHVTGDMDAEAFVKWVLAAFERVWGASIREQLDRFESFLATL